METDPAHSLAPAPLGPAEDGSAEDGTLEDGLAVLELSRSRAEHRIRMRTLAAVAAIVAVVLAGLLGFAVYLLAGSML